MGAPAAHRLTRGGLRRWAEAALAAGAVALGASIAAEATGAYGVFCGAFEAVAGAGAALHSATGRGELAHRVAGAVVANCVVERIGWKKWHSRMPRAVRSVRRSTYKPRLFACRWHREACLAVLAHWSGVQGRCARVSTRKVRATRCQQRHRGSHKLFLLPLPARDRTQRWQEGTRASLEDEDSLRG